MTRICIALFSLFLGTGIFAHEGHRHFLTLDDLFLAGEKAKDKFSAEYTELYKRSFKVSLEKNDGDVIVIFKFLNPKIFKPDKAIYVCRLVETKVDCWLQHRPLIGD